MIRSVRQTFLLASALAAGAPSLQPAIAQSPATVTMKEWTVPWEKTRPRDPYVAPDGRVWFVGQAGNYVARLDPASGTFKRYTIDEGTFPHNVIVDAQGRAWYAGNRNGMIGRIDPETGSITRYPMPDSGARDPHTLVFDRKGDIWFTVQGGNYVGKLTVASGQIQLVKMTTPNARPYGIVIDSKNRPWFDLFNSNKIGTIDPATMKLREYVLPDSARPRRIAVTSDDRIWYGDYMRGYLGMLEPATGKVREWPAPGGRMALIYGMASDDKDRIWFVETGKQPNRMIGFDTKQMAFFSNTEIESGGGTIRHMYFDPKTGLLWFGTDVGTIGRAVVSPRPAM
jgi:virginiamycin B lyase